MCCRPRINASRPLITSLTVASTRGGKFLPQVAAPALARTYGEKGFVLSVQVGR